MDRMKDSGSFDMGSSPVGITTLRNNPLKQDMLQRVALYIYQYMPQNNKFFPFFPTFV